MRAGLYIHIPFCMSKCAYCDFLSFTTGNQEEYVQALLMEMQVSDHIIDTIYVGGGTPTALPSPLLCQILDKAQTFNLAKDVEITVEMNPCTNAHGLLHDLKAHGVNRLSIGLQAWQDDLLAKVRRGHTAKEFTDTIQAAKAAGIDNVNVDLMFGLPGQTMVQWQESISQVIAHGTQHISAYSLTPAEGTPIWDAQDTLPDETTDRAMYHKVIRQLTAAGYHHYELSNFAKPGKESRHNVDCWKRKPYYGFGLGAHSFDGNARWHNTEDMAVYLQGTKKEDYQMLSPQDAAAETMFLGLRMTEGIKPLDCYAQVVENLITKGLLSPKGEKVALTPLGLDLANQVFEAFL